MDQSDLHRLEARCIQEEPPGCQTACPLHVNAREVCSHLAEGRVNQAWAVLCRTLPLPGVLARVCDGPCASGCLRSKAGGAVELAALERFCAEHATRTPSVRPLRKRGKMVAVLGAGPAGLSAAWDLAKKGFSTTVYCHRPGGCLRNVPGLPPEVLGRELDALTAMGATIGPGRMPGPELMAEVLANCDAVFVDQGDCPGLAALEYDPATLETEQPGLFAAAPDKDAPRSPVIEAAQGRRAATSIERHTQGASMTAGRDREGPFATRLFTNLDTAVPTPPIPVPDGGYTPDEARSEAARCLQCQCLECVRHCEYLAHYKGYPKVYARQIYNNESIVMGTRHANEMINSCMLCGQCEVLCPEDFDMASLCLEARRSMVRRGKMPPSAHEFALRDMAFADSEVCALARHAPGTDTSSLLFFPGCQFTATDPDAVRRTYDFLRGLRGDVGLMLRCCGAPAHWAGNESLFDASLNELRGQWRGLGSPPLIAACPTCLKMLREHLPEAQVLSLWSLLREDDAAAKFPNLAAPDAPLAISDPCAARHDASLREDVRRLLADLGVDVVEPPMTGELAPCCGFGGLAADANPPLAAQVAARRAAEVPEDYVTYCAMCRDMLARAGKPALHVLDLLLPARADIPPDTSRPTPGHSLRRENRARLKERLLANLWRAPGTPPPPHEAVAVSFTPEAVEIMENRRILISDVQKTLLAAQQGTHVLRNEDTGRLLASHRPVSVTYWVEYEADDHGGILIHNAWSHRMRVSGGPS